MGGPIRKDSVWFFAVYDYLRSASLPPRWSLRERIVEPLCRREGVSRPVQEPSGLGLVPLREQRRQRLELGIRTRVGHQMTYGVKTKNHTAAAQWQFSPDRKHCRERQVPWILERRKPVPCPSDRLDHPGFINWWKWADYGINGAFPYVDAQKASRNTVQVDLSHYAEGFLGSARHQVRRPVHERTRQSPGRLLPELRQLPLPVPLDPERRVLQKCTETTDCSSTTIKDTINPFLTVRTANSTGLFIDDRWSPDKRLTVNLGLRFDHMTTQYRDGQVYDLLTSPDEINGPTRVLRDRQSTGNIFDFKTLSPRLGVTYALTEDGKTVARAAYGGYYMPLSIEYLQAVRSRRAGVDARFQMFEVGPWSQVDTNGDGVIDTIETRNAARKVSGLTPLSEEVRTSISPGR